VSQSTFVFGMDGEPHVVRLTRDEYGVERARIGAETFETDMATAILPQGTIVSGAVDGADVVGVVRAMTDGPVLFMNGRAIALRRPEYGLAMEGLEVGDDIRSLMPGKILDVKATVGSEVKKGDALVVMEAMKMEHTLAAPRNGRIAEV